MFKCDFSDCVREFNTQGALNLHKRGAHKARPINTAGTPKPSATVAKREMVVFTSPRVKGLTVVVRPEYWEDTKVGVNAQGEIITRRTMVPGKSAQFESGVFRTDDPEIIEFLENIYNEPRFPVLSSRVVAGWAK